MPTQHEIILTPKDAPEDPYTASVLRRLGHDILASLTPEQQERLKHTLRTTRRRSRRLDLRGVVPIVFWQFYYVLVIGRDDPSVTPLLELERRRRAYLLERAIHALVLLAHVAFVVGGMYGLIRWVLRSW